MVNLSCCSIVFLSKEMPECYYSFTLMWFLWMLQTWAGGYYMVANGICIRLYYLCTWVLGYIALWFIKFVLSSCLTRGDQFILMYGWVPLVSWFPLFFFFTTVDDDWCFCDTPPIIGTIAQFLLSIGPDIFQMPAIAHLVIPLLIQYECRCITPYLFCYKCSSFVVCVCGCVWVDVPWTKISKMKSHTIHVFSLVKSKSLVIFKLTRCDSVIQLVWHPS